MLLNTVTPGILDIAICNDVLPLLSKVSIISPITGPAKFLVTESGKVLYLLLSSILAYCSNGPQSPVLLEALPINSPKLISPCSTSSNYLQQITYATYQEPLRFLKNRNKYLSFSGDDKNNFKCEKIYG